MRLYGKSIDRQRVVHRFICLVNSATYTSVVDINSRWWIYCELMVGGQWSKPNTISWPVKFGVLPISHMQVPRPISHTPKADSPTSLWLIKQDIGTREYKNRWLTTVQYDSAMVLLLKDGWLIRAESFADRKEWVIRRLMEWPICRWLKDQGTYMNS